MANCTPCEDESCATPTIVVASKYASVRDQCNGAEVLKPKPNALLYHAKSGAKPVSWRTGANTASERINLQDLWRKQCGTLASVLGLDSAGNLLGTYPDPAQGKQMLVGLAGALSWEAINLNAHCWPEDVIARKSSACDLEIAAFTTCGPDGQVCLVRLAKGTGCGVLHASGEWKEAVPAGAIAMFGGGVASLPSGWLLCDGAAYSPETYTRLYDAIGFNYGKDGSNFRVPDFRGMFARGVDYGRGKDSDASTRYSANGSLAGDAPGSYQDDEFQEHTHSGGKVTVSSFSSTIGPGGSVPKTFVASVTQSGNISGPPIANDEGDDDPRFGDETRPKNLGVNFIISAGCA